MPSELKARSVSSMLWKLMERAGSQAVSLVVTVVMARLLTPADYGALALMTVFTGICSVFVESGLNTALIQSAEADDGDFSTVYWLSTAIALVLAVVLFFAAPVIAAFYEMEVLVWPMRVQALVLLVNAYNGVQVAKITRDLQLKKSFFATLGSVAISGTAGIASALLGAGLWALVAQQLFFSLSNCLFLALQVPWHPRPVFKPRRALELFSFGWKLLVSSLLNAVYKDLSDLIIGKQFTATDLGLVNKGKSWSFALTNTIDASIKPVALSAISRVQDDLPRVKNVTRRWLKSSTYLVCPLMACLALVAEPLTRLLIGEQWLGSVAYMQMYCFICALRPINTSNLQTLNGMGRSDLFLKLEVIKQTMGLCIMLYAAFVLQSVWWMVALSMVSSILCTLVNAYPNKHVIGYGYLEQLRDIAPGVVLTLVSAALAWPVSLLTLPDIATIALQASVVCICYLGLSKIFKVEALEYLLATAKEMLGKRGRKSE